jgi:hypothetical protein
MAANVSKVSRNLVSISYQSEGSFAGVLDGKTALSSAVSSARKDCQITTQQRTTSALRREACYVRCTWAGNNGGFFPSSPKLTLQRSAKREEGGGGGGVNYKFHRSERLTQIQQRTKTHRPSGYDVSSFSVFQLVAILRHLAHHSRYRLLQ